MKRIAIYLVILFFYQIFFITCIKFKLIIMAILDYLSSKDLEKLVIDEKLLKFTRIKMQEELDDRIKNGSFGKTTNSINK